MSRKKITAREAKARWAYSEMTSDRWGRHYRRSASPQFYELANRKWPFDDLPTELHECLVAMSYGARNRQFIDNLDASPVYCREDISADQLALLRALPAFSPASDGTMILYREFHASPPRVRKNGSVDIYDPRYRIKTVAVGPFAQTEPAIVVNVGGYPVLIEGYLRSLLFMRANDPTLCFAVWWPEELSLPQ